MIKEVAFIAIAVSDKERARKFYQETLELKPSHTAMEGAWVEYDLGTTTIGVGCHPAWKPSRDGTTVAFEVEDIDATIAKLKERGVTFDMEKAETPVCWMAQYVNANRPDAARFMEVPNMGHTFQHYLSFADAFKGKSAPFDSKVLRLLTDWFEQQQQSKT